VKKKVVIQTNMKIEFSTQVIRVAFFGSKGLETKWKIKTKYLFR